MATEPTGNTASLETVKKCGFFYIDMKCDECDICNISVLKCNNLHIIRRNADIAFFLPFFGRGRKTELVGSGLMFIRRTSF